VLKLKSRIEHLIFRLMRNDGSFLVVEAMALNMLEDRAVKGVVVTMHDLTERVQAAERLMAANAELEDANADAESARAQAERALAVKSAFLSNMSHEIRTPLTGMMGMSSLLSKTELDAAQRSYVDGLRQSGRVLLGIVNDILDSEKLDYDAVKPDPEPADARELCLSILEGFAALAGEKGIELESRFEGLEGAFMLDRRLVSRILTNLVGNAVKFTEAGSVRLEASYDEGRRGGPVLAVTVRDTGIGMAPEEIGSLFARFTQLDSSYSKKYDGTGLGLHIAKRAAELLDGSIKVESEPGKGSAFTVELPCPRERVKA
jgi:two-component system, sensor histidine kinase and response regulator